MSRSVYILTIVVILSILSYIFLTSHSNTLPKEHTEIKWSERIEVISGGGYRGPWRMNDSEWRYVDDPTVAITDHGIVAVAWGDQERQDIYLQVFEANGTKRFEEPVNVSRNPGIFSWLPRMVVTSDDATDIYILWQEIVFSGGSHGGEIFFAKSNDGGTTFNGPLNLSNTIAGAGKGRLTQRYWHNGSLDITISPEGTIYTVWTEYEGALWFSRSTDDGESFLKPTQISGSNEIPARAPSIAVRNDGEIFVAWTVGEDPSANVHVVRSGDGGESFSEPVVVYESRGHADAPKLIADSKGTIHLVYAESAGGPFRSYRILYTRLKEGESFFEKPREIAREHSDKYGSIHYPMIDIDGDDTLYVIWKLFPRNSVRPLGLGFAFSNDGGDSFSPPSVVPETDNPRYGFTGSMNGLLMQKIAVNSTGAIAVVNSNFNMNQSSHIWLIRGNRGE